MAIWDRFFGASVSTAVGYGMGSAIGPALNPVTQKVANEVWAKYPDRPLTPEEAAEAVIRAVMGLDEAEAEALANGINKHRFDVLRKLAGEPPGPQQVLELWNRGAIDEPQVDTALRQSRMRPEWYAAFKVLRRYLVPVADLVRFAVREVFSPEQRAALDLDAEYPDALTPRAQALGLDPQDAKDYWAAHWNLPSATQGFEMFHRGLISSDQLDGLLKALDYAPTWRGKLRAIARALPSLSDLTRFAVREAYQDDTAAKYGYDDDYPERFTADVALHGMDPARAKQFWRAHWRLPSVSQGYRMRYRKEIGDAELDDLLRIQDYPSYWRKRLMATRFLVPGRVDLRRLFIAGKLTRAEVKEGYERLGYETGDAELLTQLAEALKAEQAVEGVGSHVTKAQTQLWTTTHRTYLNGDVTATVAKNNLGRVGVPVADRDGVVALWDAERELQRKQLTAAQVKKAWLKATRNPATGAAWTRDDAIMELVTRGYTVNDANTFLDLPTA